MLQASHMNNFIKTQDRMLQKLSSLQNYWNNQYFEVSMGFKSVSYPIYFDDLLLHSYVELANRTLCTPVEF